MQPGVKRRNDELWTEGYVVDSCGLAWLLFGDGEREKGKWEGGRRQKGHSQELFITKGDGTGRGARPREANTGTGCGASRGARTFLVTRPSHIQFLTQTPQGRRCKARSPGGSLVGCLTASAAPKLDSSSFAALAELSFMEGRRFCPFIHETRGVLFLLRRKSPRRQQVAQFVCGQSPSRQVSFVSNLADRGGRRGDLIYNMIDNLCCAPCARHLIPEPQAPRHSTLDFWTAEAR